MWDALVAGAGPAGSVAAYVLARRGHRVMLADAPETHDHKVGEALAGAAVRLLRSIGLPVPDKDGPHAPIGGNLSCWSTDQLIATDFMRDPDGSGWRLDRLRFDADLRAAATRAGTAYRAARARDLQRQGAGWRIRFDDSGSDTAQWVVDATGRRTSLARRIGAKRMRDARLIALYAIGKSVDAFRLNRTMIEAVPRGWWYAARLPSGVPIAGFHTDPRHAAQLACDPDAWRYALAETRHVGPILANAEFDRLLDPLEACGAQLDRFVGDGWIACGDAALSFDPISGQGILSALHTGLAAGRFVGDALAGRNAAPDAYATRLARIRQIYLARSCQAYRSESRWHSEPFWSTVTRHMRLLRDRTDGHLH
jgi:flavin-dependent dehydrogenase